MFQTTNQLYTELRCYHECLSSEEPIESKPLAKHVRHMNKEWAAPTSNK